MSVQELLCRMIASGKVPHALLFAGPRGAGKKKSAHDFALSLLKTEKKIENHPDLHQFYPEGKVGLHPISSIRKLIDDAHLAPFESPWKIFILHEADKMLPASSNALLKILEEPPKHTLILLLTQHSERLLPTILSRCQILEFPHGQNLEIDQGMLDLLAEGFTKEKITTFESNDPDAVFETLLFWYRDRLLIELEAPAYLHFPQYLPQIQATPFVPLETVEKEVRQARLAFERSTKLITCLEILSLSLVA